MTESEVADAERRARLEAVMFKLDWAVRTESVVYLSPAEAQHLLDQLRQEPK